MLQELPIKLPIRAKKPRQTGLTFVIDNGLGTQTFTDIIDSHHDKIDGVKFGWGTSLVTNELEKKISLLQAHEITYWLGGTLFEIAYIQKKIPEFLEWVKRLGSNVIEVSDGSITIPQKEKLKYIEALSGQFQVFSEVGSKDDDMVMSPRTWVNSIKAELSAGASKVITEGRESGTAGIYRPNGEIREGLIQEILETDITFSRLIFEAPHKQTQAWFIKHVSPAVNLGNIAFYDVISLETLRLGLRSDTLPMFHPQSEEAL